MEKQKTRRPDRHAGRKSVPYKDAVRFGLIAALVTFVVSSVVTQGSRFSQEGFAAIAHLGLPALLAGVAFVAATAVAMLLNWVVSRKDVEPTVDKPVLD
ncbi:MAG: hypothetical protein ACTHVY_07430 [Brevibacterium yomogidense]|uniref:hypothetical protein n=1 Tax=Brevibacterium TaxID=1696 RepID=UPI000B350371|nr:MULTISPECIES: hypothetical protein [Brevibacterium]